MISNTINEMNSMFEEMNRLFNGNLPRVRLIERQGNLAKQGNFRLPISDIRETESSVLATFEVPGADKKDIDKVKRAILQLAEFHDR